MGIISIIIMAVFYIVAGLNHFRNPDFYLKMIPKYLPYPKSLNFISGALEVIFGLMLFYQPLRNYALIGIITLLIAVFPANVEMVSSDHFKMIPKKWKLLRLPLQGVVIYWAYFHIKL
jgi:uncharacterized membrane protein